MSSALLGWDAHENHPGPSALLPLWLLLAPPPASAGIVSITPFAVPGVQWAEGTGSVDLWL
jgi:hypothetical protein